MASSEQNLNQRPLNIVIPSEVGSLVKSGLTQSRGLAFCCESFPGDRSLEASTSFPLS
jgi:hypothetical protein